MAKRDEAERGARSLLVRETNAHPAAFSPIARLRLRNAPMLLHAACFAAGILCRTRWQSPRDLILMCLLLLLTAVIAWARAPRLMWPAVAMLWMSLGWAAGVLEPSAYDPSLLPYADQLQRMADAHVVAVHPLPQRAATQETQPEEMRGEEESAFAAQGPPHEATEQLDLSIDAIEDPAPDVSRMVPVGGSAKVTLLKRKDGPDTAAIACGAHIHINVRMHPPQRYLDPGVWQYADALAARGIAVEGSADPASIQVIDTSHRPWDCRLAAAQQWSSRRLQALADSSPLMHFPAAMRLTQQDTGVLSAMLFGDRTQLDRSIRTAFERTGSFHLFVVAGMHVALLLAALYFLLLRAHLPQWLAASIACALTTGYAMLTGFGAPLQRALLMSAVYLVTQLLGRRRNALNALGAAALAMLVLHPGALFEAGFQMTVLAVVAIAGIALPIAARTFHPYAQALRDLAHVRIDSYAKPKLAQFRISLRWLGEELAGMLSANSESRLHRIARHLPAFLISCLLKVLSILWITLCAEMVMALPMALYFHRLTPFAAPANLLVLPLVGALMLCAVAAFTASLIHPLLAVLPAAFTALLLHGVTGLIATFSALHGADVRMPAPLLAVSLFAVVLWAAAMYLIRLPEAQTGRLACLLLPLAFVSILLPRRPDIHHGALEFTAIDVGQGDALLAASPTGGTMLIDAGGPTGSGVVLEQSAFDIGEEVVSPYLWSRGLRRLDIAVLTHAHSDHIGGMEAVLRNFHPRELWVSADVDTPPFHALLHEAAELGVTVRHLRAGTSEAWGGTQLSVLGPAMSYTPHLLPTNDDSLVLRIDYGRSSILAEGDAERPSEEFLTHQPARPVTLLKVGHHGSSTSTTAELLMAFHPAAAVISCGRGNRFGHPRMQVLQRLQSAGIRTIRTDVAGMVQYILFPDGSLEIHTPGAQ